MKNVLITVVVLIGCLLTGFGIFTLTPAGRAMINDYKNAMAEVDEATLYENKKKVEDTCRSLIAQYNTEKLGYQNKLADAEKEEDATKKRMDIETAQAHRDRANSIAMNYNDFILKNSHVWKENVPSDITLRLDIIE